MPDSGQGFGLNVSPGGYAWWYLDGLSDDGKHGLTIIGFLGSVFSPYYARAKRHDPEKVDPLDFCAFNVALYGGSGKRWAMTERGRPQLTRSASSLAIGSSSMRWEGDSLSVMIDEWTVPWPSHLRGVVRLFPDALFHQTYPLDLQSAHRWRPIAPCSRIEVNFDHPGLRWTGQGYLDSNWGDEPLETAFRGWHWSRANTASGTAGIYDVARRIGSAHSLAMHFMPTGEVYPFVAPAAVELAKTPWGVKRVTRSDHPFSVRVVSTLENAPFYARSMIDLQLFGRPARGFHESLCLDRFASRWVQSLLPFRMPRFTW